MNTDYRHLNVDERVFIQLALERGCTLRAIARSVQRAPSTISRELARNAWIRPPKHHRRGRPRLAGGYRAVPAQERAVLLAQTPRVSRRLFSFTCPTVGKGRAPSTWPKPCCKPTSRSSSLLWQSAQESGAPTKRPRPAPSFLSEGVKPGDIVEADISIEAFHLNDGYSPRHRGLEVYLWSLGKAMTEQPPCPCHPSTNKMNPQPHRDP